MDALYVHPHDSMDFVDLTVSESYAGFVRLGHSVGERETFEYKLTPQQARAIAADLRDFADAVEKYDFREGA